MQSIAKKICLSVLIVAVALLIADCIFPLKLPDEQKDFSQLVVAKDGQPLRAFADNHGIWRQQVSMKDVSPLYIEALLNYEDRWFWHHPGVNPFSLVRAFWLNWRCDCIVSGGSTLTMQVARRFHPHSRTIKGKFQQILRAIQLEWHFSKQEILELYINYAPFGGTIEGVQAASYAYLEKSASSLTHADAALLAVLPQAPSRMRPDRYPGRAQKARDKVLRRLVEFKVWDEMAVQRAQQERVSAVQPQRPSIAPLLSRHLKQMFPTQRVIRSTIDVNLQRGLEDDIYSWIQSQPQHSSAAILIVDNTDQSVLAYIGSADFTSPERFGHVDMIQAIRSPGSTLKPFVYAMAIEQGLIHSHSLLSDAPRHYGDYRPENFSRGFSGPVSVTEALQRSLNVPAVQVLEHLGSHYFYSRMRNGGIQLTLPAHAKPNLSIALGGAGIRLWDLVGAYSSLAHNGELKPIRIHTMSNSSKYSSRYLVSSDAAWITYKMLSSNTRPDRIYSSHVQKRENPIAWKTGTSYGYRDAWAIGVSQDYTIGVWLGRPDGTPQPGHYGALNASPLLFRISDYMHKQGQGYIAKPKTVQLEDICWPLGMKSSRTKKLHCHQTHQAWLANQVAPPTLNDSQGDWWADNPLTINISTDKKKILGSDCIVPVKENKTIALWPQVLEPWLPKKKTLRGQLPASDERCKSTPNLAIRNIEIIGLGDGDVYRSARRNGDLPSISLQALGGVGIRDWFVNGRYIFSAGQQQSLPYQFTQLGNHQIVAIDRQGNADRLEVMVKDGL